MTGRSRAPPYPHPVGVTCAGRNGRTIYLVGASILYSNPDWGGEITVLQGDEQLAHILCRDGTVEFSADRLAKEPAGS